MTTPTTIRRLTARPLDIPLHGPFGIAGGAQDIAHCVLVSLELTDGTMGYGEAAPFTPYNGETQTGVLHTLEQVRASVEGADVREWRRIAALLAAQAPGSGAARCAIETAVLDALTRHSQMPLWAFFGGASTRLETDMTITLGCTTQAVTAAQDVQARGISIIKVKVGGGDPALDRERVQAIHATVPDAPLILDGNSGYDAAGALRLLDDLAAEGILPVLFEQPVSRDDWFGMQQVAANGRVPVAADESAAGLADVLRIAREQAAQVVNIKLMKQGIAEALDMAALCRATGLELMIGGMVESILAMTTSACFAAGLGGFRFVDLDTPMFMAENPFSGGFAQQGGTLDVGHIRAGHGVTPLAQR
jgi:L-alanine-DL-glutamate epimerase-like enolase superfamily enzyme